jgi:hypothetical protein
MAVATRGSDTSVIDIPFLIRGQIVEPGDDAVEFSGRVGARFRTPDPKKWADRLVLADAGDLADLRDMPVDEIIDFLVELGPRLTLDENPLLQEAYRLCYEAGELTEPLLRTFYDDFLGWFTRPRLESMVAAVGKEYLDGWVEQGLPGHSYSRVRAFGTRQLHIIAGNVPVTTAITVARCALTKSDCLIKMPSNDPYTAAAVVQSMIDLDPNHPVTKHFAVPYWKGGDEEVEQRIIRPQRLERLTAWGGFASVKHIQKYLLPGLELISFNGKWSISIVGHEALENDENMKYAAYGVAVRAGEFNQTGCSNTRIVYVECDADDEEDLARLERFGHEIHKAFGELPEWFSTPPKRVDAALDAELEAVGLDEEFYRVIGDSSFGGAVVSRTEDPVEFQSMLNNRIVNLVPVSDITNVGDWVKGDETQTIGVYPESLRERLRDAAGTYGGQRIVPLKREGKAVGAGAIPEGARHDPSKNIGTHDGVEVLRRMVRWVVDESLDLR